MENYFGINYCFDKKEVHSIIENIVINKGKGYVCVADGVTLSMSHKSQNLKNVLNEASLTVCDSGWVPLYLKSLYGIKREQYSGSDLLMDVVRSKKYRILFIGSTPVVLDALKNRLSQIDERIETMSFISLPFLSIDAFDYSEIASVIKQDKPDLIFVSLGMPKQEFFMHKLKPHLDKGVLIGVGAAFKFHSGLPDNRRAPRWMIKAKIEWLHRIFSEPEKQIKRCSLIFRTMPGIYLKEYRKKLN